MVEGKKTPLEEMRKERLKKLEELKKLGVNPYPYSFEKNSSSAELQAKYSSLKPGDVTKDAVSFAGRILLKRDMGKVQFMHLQDEKGRVQAYFKKDTLKEQFKLLKLLDLGDFLGVEGFMFKTKMGEVTIHVERFSLLAKALLPPPEKYHGLKDKELRYRKRYLDLMMNKEVRELFEKRSIIIKEIRSFLDEKGFLEVETPTLQPVYGGAAARPFITKHNALDMTMYLRISDELYLKRLLVGGYEKVYEICKDFRNEGIDKSHNPEFTMIEWYQAYGDYNTGMEMVENLVARLALKIHGSTKIKYQGRELNLTPPWKRMTMKEALQEHGSLNVDCLTREELLEKAKELGLEVEDETPRGLIVEALFEELCEPQLWQPTFITEFPIETTPLCKPLRTGDQSLVERFEPYIACMEVGNAYSELNDPLLQRELFLAERKGDESHPLDLDFLEALEHGMPPTSGVGLGVDRLVMILLDQPSIRDVILFPTLRPK